VIEIESTAGRPWIRQASDCYGLCPRYETPSSPAPRGETDIPARASLFDERAGHAERFAQAAGAELFRRRPFLFVKSNDDTNVGAVRPLAFIRTVVALVLLLALAALLAALLV
jgi:hypothetical protein